LKTICTCRICRRNIREQIELVWDLDPRWMGEFTIRFHSDLGWVPLRLYRSILSRMVRLGIVIKLMPDRPDEFPVYLLSRCMVPVQVLAQRAGNEVRP
jgi:hypothetical protein